MTTPKTTTAPAVVAPLPYRQVLRSRNIPPLPLAASLSRLASSMLLFVVVLYVFAQFRSASTAGLSGFFPDTPRLPHQPDRGRRCEPARRAAGRGISGIALLALGGALAEPVLFALLTLSSLTIPLTAGGIRTLFPKFVTEAAYDKANALDLSTYAVIDVAGPLLAAALFSLIGRTPTLLTVANMYTLSAQSPTLLRGGTAEASPAQRRPLLRAAWEGVTYLTRNPTLRGLAVSYALYQAAAGMLIVTVPAATAEQLGDGGPTDRYVGVMWVVMGLAEAGRRVVRRQGAARRCRAPLHGRRDAGVRCGDLLGERLRLPAGPRRRSGGGGSGRGNGERGLAVATAAAHRTRLTWTHHDRLGQRQPDRLPGRNRVGWCADHSFGDHGAGHCGPGGDPLGGRRPVPDPPRGLTPRTRRHPPEQPAATRRPRSEAAGHPAMSHQHRVRARTLTTPNTPPPPTGDHHPAAPQHPPGVPERQPPGGTPPGVPARQPPGPADPTGAHRTRTRARPTGPAPAAGGQPPSTPLGAHPSRGPLTRRDSGGDQGPPHTIHNRCLPAQPGCA